MKKGGHLDLRLRITRNIEISFGNDFGVNIKR